MTYSSRRVYKSTEVGGEDKTGNLLYNPQARIEDKVAEIERTLKIAGARSFSISVEWTGMER